MQTNRYTDSETISRSTARRRWRALAVLATAGLALAACGSSNSATGSPSTAATAGGSTTGSTAATSARSSDPVLTLAMSGLDPAFHDPVQDEFEGYVGDGEYLLRPTEGGTAPWLAEKAEMVDPTMWKITMRAGLKYQNGSPVTMAKVKSWLDHELVTSEEFGEKYKGATTAIDEAAHSITVTFPGPQAGFGYELSNYTLHFYDWDMVQTVGSDFNKLAGMGVYTGPYMLTEVTPSKWTYKANPNYWQGVPALDKIELLGVADGQAGLKAVQAGEADAYIFADPALKPTAVASRLHFNPGKSAEYEALLPNLDKAPWNDPVVRRALAMTIDSADISQKGVFGVFPEIHGLFPSSSEYALDWVKPDVAGANKLLDDNGWVKGADGVRAKGGVRLQGDILSYNPQLQELAVPLGETAKAAGFALGSKKLDYQVWSSSIKSRDYDLTMQNNENFGINGEITVSCRLYFSDKDSGASKGAGQEPTIKQACARLATDRSPATAKDVLKTVQQVNSQQAFVIPVTQRVSSWITSDAWKSAAPDAFYIPVTWQLKAG